MCCSETFVLGVVGARNPRSARVGGAARRSSEAAPFKRDNWPITLVDRHIA